MHTECAARAAACVNMSDGPTPFAGKVSRTVHEQSMCHRWPSRVDSLNLASFVCRCLATFLEKVRLSWVHSLPGQPYALTWQAEFILHVELVL